MVKGVVGTALDKETYPGAKIRQGLDELTVRVRRRKEQRAFVDTGIKELKWIPPFVDSDWNALFQTLFAGVEQEDLVA